MSKRRKNKELSIWQVIIGISILIGIVLYEYIKPNTDIASKNNENDIKNTTIERNVTIDLSSIPEYSSNPYVEINNNIPYFTEEDYTTRKF